MKYCSYAVMAFGGRAPFDKPESVYYQSSQFTHNYTQLPDYFRHIDINGEGRDYGDVLEAIVAASRLNFRPGVPRTFILMLCKECRVNSNTHYDYTSILQHLMEETITLHVLANEEFEFNRNRKVRHFFGLDRELLYSKRYPDGDAEARNQLLITRNNMGRCISLAMETNGAAFTIRRLLRDGKPNANIKGFITIFAKRIAKSLTTSKDQVCECSGHNNGLTYMSCTSSFNPLDNSNFDYYVSTFCLFLFAIYLLFKYKLYKCISLNYFIRISVIFC